LLKVMRVKFMDSLITHICFEFQFSADEMLKNPITLDTIPKKYTAVVYGFSRTITIALIEAIIFEICTMRNL
jgi:hypothetical protein